MKVLIVEDNEDIKDILSQFYESLGMRVVWTDRCSNVGWCLGQNPDIRVISWDYQLRDCSSLEEIRRVHRDGFTGLMIAASSSETCREAQMVAGCTLNMPLPLKNDKLFVPDELREALAAMSR